MAAQTQLRKVQNVVFSSGRIEFDLAFPGRTPPWICFGVQSKDDADKVMFNPWSKNSVPGASRLYQAVLTKRKRNSLVINYRESSDAFDASLWAHIKFDMCAGRRRIFLEGDRTPAIELDNPFARGTIGIQGNCYIRNLRVHANEP